jgi:hypothetical protein
MHFTNYFVHISHLILRAALQDGKCYDHFQGVREVKLLAQDYSVVKIYLISKILSLDIMPLSCMVLQLISE